VSNFIPIFTAIAGYSLCLWHGVNIDIAYAKAESVHQFCEMHRLSDEKCEKVQKIIAD